jgi:hypothetical protein
MIHVRILLTYRLPQYLPLLSFSSPRTPPSPPPPSPPAPPLPPSPCPPSWCPALQESPAPSRLAPVREPVADVFYNVEELAQIARIASKPVT